MRNDVLAALKELHVPVLRWPGGCFADEYHWRDGIGPRDKRPRRPNSSWGGIDDDDLGRCDQECHGRSFNGSGSERDEYFRYS
ncbi:MAG TPA: hypothetical protein VFD75_07735 [Pyrinomonadaceae bacterium]|nr:hypothetical protein [Pyrinomonadaceae bacterium]